MAFAEDYVPVADRIVAFRDKYPEGTLQPFEPWRLVEVAGSTFIVYTAAAYRAPDDPRPGVGTAWEPCPGLTNFTRNSELQNAETSAWGRALIAVGAADAKKGVASAEDVRNRRAEQDGTAYISAPNVAAIRQKCDDADVSVALVVAGATNGRTEDPAELYVTEIAAARDVLAELTSASHDPTQIPPTPPGEFVRPKRTKRVASASHRGQAPLGASVGTAGSGSGTSSGAGPTADPSGSEPT